MKTHQAPIRQLHRSFAPVLFLPILLTLITGSVYQVLELGGRGDDFAWLLNWHKGHFGILNLKTINPFLIVLGLLILTITGTQLWLQRRKPQVRSKEI